MLRSFMNQAQDFYTGEMTCLMINQVNTTEYSYLLVHSHLVLSHIHTMHHLISVLLYNQLTNTDVKDYWQFFFCKNCQFSTSFAV